jgi:hypothetical protein
MILFYLILIDKRLALKARLFKTIGCTINLLRIYSYNAKISPIILILLKIYAKNGEIYITINIKQKKILFLISDNCFCYMSSIWFTTFTSFSINTR